MKHTMSVLAAVALLTMSSCGLRDVDFSAAKINCEGCPEVILSGVTTGVDLPLAQPYHKIEAKGMVSMVYTDSVSTLRLEADSVLVPYFKSNVCNGTLFLSLDSISVADSFNLVVYIPVNPSLNDIELSGICNFDSRVPFSVSEFEIETSGVNSVSLCFDMPDGKLTMDLGGVAAVEAEGCVDKADINLSGVGELDAAKLVTQQCTIGVSGTSSASIACEGHLKADVSGMSSLDYTGGCTTEIEKSGLASVDKDGE